MKILFNHPEVVPVKRYGGTERILYWLMKELVLLGHEVVLVGNPKSQVKEIGVELIPHESDWRYLIPSDVDILHLFISPHLKFDQPLMVTLHGNGQVGESFHQNTVFLSRKHAENHGSKEFVYNGIDLSEYPAPLKKKLGWDKFLFLAKASWKVKNLKDCIKACKTNEKYLEVAGGKGFSLSSYIHYNGLVDQVKKLELLNEIDALLWPVRWHEPFGVAVIESMALGAPVISSRYGSLPELINEKTGILCDNYFEFEKAVGLAENTFDQEYLRHYVESNFTAKIMAENYLKYYQRVIDGEALNPTNPYTITAGDLLPF
ncbi:MAG: glycosyltransferase family 4 protein [Epsilonproteobacteria bacterium]|nr:MAG: glycosyltransferase family 4 protein [Campylobacterota bacterium]RLA66882.1 MAG: glycosyltransferase family 4 protein [Campylobacterota bacterium]